LREDDAKSNEFDSDETKNLKSFPQLSRVTAGNDLNSKIKTLPFL
jgi:hypothetical protein